MQTHDLGTDSFVGLGQPLLQFLLIYLINGHLQHFLEPNLSLMYFRLTFKRGCS